MEKIDGRTVQKDLMNRDYYDGMVSHPEPDILECKVKQALRNSAVIKASGRDEISSLNVEYLLSQSSPIYPR